MKKHNIIVACLALAATALTCGCGSTGTGTGSSDGTDAVSNVSQSTVAQANSTASSSESSSGVGFTDGIDAIQNLVDPQDSIHATATTCNYSTVRSTCSSSANTITWGGCTIDSGLITLTGSYNEAFSGTSASTCTVPIVSGETMTRTSTGSTITFPSGAAITEDTNGGTAYDGSTVPATGTTVSNSSGTRTITVNGTHRVLTGPKGTKLFDHFIKTTTPLSVTGTRAGGNRIISGGVVALYHNLAKYTATTTFTNVTWGSSTCCYPTSGSISTSFAGSLTGTSSMTFTSTCGQATHVDNTGTNSNVTTTVTLNQCH